MSGWNWNDTVSPNLGNNSFDNRRRSSTELISRLRTGSEGTQYFSRSRRRDHKKDETVNISPQPELLEIANVQKYQEKAETEEAVHTNVELSISVAEINPLLIPLDGLPPPISANGIGRCRSNRNKICIIPMRKVHETDSKLWQRHGNNHLGLVLSALYAKLLVVCGTGFSLAEVISSYIPASFYDGFYLYLYFMSILFMTGILGHVIKVKAHKHARNFAQGVSKVSSSRCRKNSPLNSLAETGEPGIGGGVDPNNKLNKINSFELCGTSSSESAPPSPSEISPPSPRKRQQQRIKNLIIEKETRKEKGTHFGSFYLRMGAVAFGVGSMIYSGLEFGQYFELKPDEKCHSYMLAITPAVRMTFTFMQMYFIFLNSKMAVSKVSLSSQFGLMHMIGTNLCVWLNVLVQETKHEILNFYDPDNKTITFRYEKAHKAYLNIADDSRRNENASIRQNYQAPSLFSTTTTKTALHFQHRFTRGLKGPHTMMECGRTNIMGSIVQDAAPFLFPCTIEYSLICAAICYVMWKSMAKRRTARVHHRYSSAGSQQAFTSIASRSPHHYTVDCARANKGLFVGIFFLVMTIMSIIINLVLDTREEYRHFADLEMNIIEIVLYTSATIAVIIGMCQVRVLRYAKQRNLELDNILLIVSQTGSLIFNVFTIISGQFKGEKLVLITALSKVIQLLMQTLFILDASNREAATMEQVRTKPGREVITFLLVTNLAMWLINALEKSRGESHPAQLQFYGVWGWTIITHISMPLAIFYRFHSTVCLVEIWKKAFKLKRS